MKTDKMKKQTDRERIYLAIKSSPNSTASEIAEMVGLDSPTTNSGIHSLISIGKVFRSGEKSISANRKLTMFSVVEDAPKVRQIPNQTWLSALMQ
jgi:predicted ArsR family transcriptional regulator